MPRARRALRCRLGVNRLRLRHSEHGGLAYRPRPRRNAAHLLLVCTDSIETASEPTSVSATVSVALPPRPARILATALLAFWGCWLLVVTAEQRHQRAGGERRHPAARVRVVNFELVEAPAVYHLPARWWGALRRRDRLEGDGRDSTCGPRWGAHRRARARGGHAGRRRRHGDLRRLHARRRDLHRHALQAGHMRALAAQGVSWLVVRAALRRRPDGPPRHAMLCCNAVQLAAARTPALRPSASRSPSPPARSRAESHTHGVTVSAPAHREPALPRLRCRAGDGLRRRTGGVAAGRHLAVLRAHRRRARAPGARAGVGVPAAAALILLQHEVGSHGGRAREFGLGLLLVRLPRGATAPRGRRRATSSSRSSPSAASRRTA